MAAGDPFTIAPNTVITEEPIFNNEQSETESEKKEYFNVSETPIERYRLEFEGRSHSDRELILGHIRDQFVDFYSFLWQSVPNYINSGADITGRWVKGSYSETPVSGKWKINITFEKAN